MFLGKEREGTRAVPLPWGPREVGRAHGSLGSCAIGGSSVEPQPLPVVPVWLGAGGTLEQEAVWSRGLYTHLGVGGAWHWLGIIWESI